MHCFLELSKSMRTIGYYFVRTGQIGISNGIDSTATVLKSIADVMRSATLDSHSRTCTSHTLVLYLYSCVIACNVWTTTSRYLPRLLKQKICQENKVDVYKFVVYLTISSIFSFEYCLLRIIYLYLVVYSIKKIFISSNMSRKCF